LNEARERDFARWRRWKLAYRQQVAAGVLAFDGATRQFTALTPSFLPFINSATNDIRWIGMSVAMTTWQICITAKGEIDYTGLVTLFSATVAPLSWWSACDMGRLGACQCRTPSFWRCG